jgi:ketosteroid isomerase-like protein
MMTAADDTSALAEAERSLYRAMIAKDFTALEESLASDLCYVHSTGVAETRDEYLRGVADGRYDYATIVSRDVRIRVVDDLGVMNGIVTMAVGKRGMPKDTLDLLFVLVWVRKTDRWRLAIRHATRMLPSP